MSAPSSSTTALLDRSHPARPPAEAGARGGPRHAPFALAAIAAVAAVLYAWGLGGGEYQPFYADAVRSMTESWKAFFFGSFDPGNTITLDKLPGFLWPQALSARIFGFHPWSVTLPQVVEGVLSVLVLYRMVRRWAGANAGLLAAGAFAVTPVVVGLFRGATEEPAFTLLLLLAAEATQRAAREGRTRPLVLAGVWVGLAFQAKMLEAWAVLPVLGAVHLVTAPSPLRRRLGQLAAAGVVSVMVSVSWMAVVSAVPPEDRPWLDGTTDNSAVSMVVDYNFLNRFSATGSGGHQAHGGAVEISQHGAGADTGAAVTSSRGWGKLFGSSLAAQTGWLYPFAGFAAVGGLVSRRGRPRTDPVRAGWLLWAGWAALFALVFSAGSIGGHAYYMGVLAAGLAALTGAGVPLFWRAFRSGGRRRSVLALPAAVACTAGWDLYVSHRFPDFLPWLGPLAVVLGALALVLLAAGRGRGRRLAVTGLTAGLAAVLVAPASWASTVLVPRYAHSSGTGGVGPARFRPAARAGGEPQLTADQQSLLSYTLAHREGSHYAFATTSWAEAAPYILATGEPVMPMGGFTGRVPAPRLADFQDEVGDGRLRFVLIGPEGRDPGRLAANTQGIVRWVRIACVVVPPAEYGGSGDSGGQLYNCDPDHFDHSDGD